MFGVQSILDDLPPTPEAPGRSQPTQTLSESRPFTDLVGTGARKEVKLGLGTIVSSSIPGIAPTTEPMPISAEVPSKATHPPPNSVLVFEQAALGASTTPPFSEDELSPTSPTEQLSRSLHNAPTSRTAHQMAPALPTSFRTQTTPVRPVFQQGRIQHKYSPAVPSPLSRVVRVESPPSSPESNAQREAQRPPVIAEEEEEEEEVVAGAQIVAVEEAAAEEPDEVEEPPLHIGGRPGSLSPLSRIMNMGLSPAIAPTLAIPSFPGLLGTGPLKQDLLAKPKQTTIGFGKMPGGFQLGTAIQAQSLLTNTTTATGTTRMTAKTIKTTAVTTKQKPKQEQRPKPTKVAFAESRPRSSKESTSSSGSAGSSSEGRTSRTSSKTSAGGGAVPKPNNGVVKGAVKGKENEVKRKPIVSSRPAPIKKPAPAVTKLVTKAPVANTIKRTAGVAPSTKPITSRAPKG